MSKKKISILVNKEQESIIRGIFCHYGWDIESAEEIDEGRREADRAAQEIEENRVSSDLHIPRDPSAEECPHCFCQPCVTTVRQHWLGTGQRASDRNAVIRKTLYRKFWTLLCRRGTWLDPRYIERKSLVMRVERAVVSKRELIPDCVLRLVRGMYPNPQHRKYLWQSLAVRIVSDHHSTHKPNGPFPYINNDMPFLAVHAVTNR